MEWALGLFERLDWPENICSVEECAAKIREFCSLEEFERSVSLRPERELLDAADLYYRLHWACRDAAANGYPLPEKVLSEAAAERRRGCSGQPAAGRRRERHQERNRERCRRETAGIRRI